MHKGGTSKSGLIPARAGNTHPSQCRAPTSRAHPRSRGEHSAVARMHNNLGGSSPLARGTHFLTDLLFGCAGLIPARAGNTNLTSQPLATFEAHPRSRGEHHPFVFVQEFEGGSSPLARGTRNGSGSGHRCDGLIPARAGNTLQSFTTPPSRWAHPRSRGEHLPKGS